MAGCSGLSPVLATAALQQSFSRKLEVLVFFFFFFSSSFLPKIVTSVSCSVRCLVCPGLSYAVRGTSYDPWSLLSDSEPRCRPSGGRQCLQVRFDSRLVQSVWCLGCLGLRWLFRYRFSIINPSYRECDCSAHGVKLLMVEFWVLLAKSHVEEELGLCSGS